MVNANISNIIVYKKSGITIPLYTHSYSPALGNIFYHSQTHTHTYIHTYFYFPKENLCYSHKFEVDEVEVTIKSVGSGFG